MGDFGQISFSPSSFSPSPLCYLEYEIFDITGMKGAIRIPLGIFLKYNLFPLQIAELELLE